MNTADLREVVTSLASSAYALSALGAALQARATSRPVRPELREHVEAVVTALHVREAVDQAAPSVVRALLGEVRVALLHGVQRVSAGSGEPSWSSPDPRLLQGAGDVSAAFPLLLGRLLPSLPGLGTRLDAEGARFLDVGVGVGVLSIEMAHRWPRLAVTGVDVWAPALALARENVTAAGLERRIELREQSVVEVDDVNAFDLAWVPSAFLARDVLPPALDRLHRALRPGGWILFATLSGAADPLEDALVRLRTVEWGGHPWTTAEAAHLLEQRGYREIVVLPSGAGAGLRCVVGRRAEE